MPTLLKSLIVLALAVLGYGFYVSPIAVIAMGAITGAFFVRELTCELAGVYLWK